MVEGAHVYIAQCAFCHGTPGHPSEMAKAEYPGSPQLWKKHTHGDVVGVSDDSVGETYWKVANGIRLTGMPSFVHILSQQQMWNVSLLLAQADKQQLPEVAAILNQSGSTSTSPAVGGAETTSAAKPASGHSASR